MAAKFEIYEDAAKAFRFRLKAANGEIVAAARLTPPGPVRSPEPKL